MDKRKVSFESIDDVLSDIQNLHASGYQAAGNWNLAQVCQHLNCWMGYSIDGYPKPPWFLGPVLWTMKVLFGKKQFQKVLAEGGFKDGLMTMPKTVFSADAAADEEAIAEFSHTLQRFKQFSGPPAASPLFGEMTLDECRQLQLIHCRHHLAFLKPQ